MRTQQNRIIAVEKLLSSREVEGNGPMKPGNPLSNVASRVPIPVKCSVIDFYNVCVSQDEGNMRCCKPLIDGAFLLPFFHSPGTFQVDSE